MIYAAHYIGLLLLSSLYAIALEISERRYRLISRRIWLVVVVGDALVLLWLPLLPVKLDWFHVVAHFAVAGLPQIARSLGHELANEIATEGHYLDSTETLAQKLRVSSLDDSE